MSRSNESANDKAYMYITVYVTYDILDNCPYSWINLLNAGFKLSLGQAIFQRTWGVMAIQAQFSYIKLSHSGTQANWVLDLSCA